MPSQEYLKKLMKRKKTLDARVASTKAKLKKEERKKETRKKILVGGYFLEKFKQEKKLDKLSLLMEEYLTSDFDRTIFNLEKKNGSTSKSDEIN